MAVVAIGAKRRSRAGGTKVEAPVADVVDVVSVPAGDGALADAGDGPPPIARDAIAQAAAGLGGAGRLIDWVNADPANERTFWGTIFLMWASGVRVSPGDYKS